MLKKILPLSFIISTIGCSTIQNYKVDIGLEHNISSELKKECFHRKNSFAPEYTTIENKIDGFFIYGEFSSIIDFHEFENCLTNSNNYSKSPSIAELDFNNISIVYTNEIDNCIDLTTKYLFSQNHKTSSTLNRKNYCLSYGFK